MVLLAYVISIFFPIDIFGFTYDQTETGDIPSQPSITTLHPSIGVQSSGSLSSSNIGTIQDYKTNPSQKTFSFTVRGAQGSIPILLYQGLDAYYSKKDPYLYLNQNSELKFINDELQKQELSSLLSLIRSKTSNADDQVRIAVSLVQTIPYDYDNLYSPSMAVKYPYNVLYENRGICMEKSMLLALLLKDLGYGVVLFKFEKESHMAVGILAPSQYGYRGTSYAFVETTRPSIITDSNNNYLNTGKLTSYPEIIKISDGKSFNSISEEYRDAIEWNELQVTSEKNGRVLQPDQYQRWVFLANKYGIASGASNGKNVQTIGSNTNSYSYNQGQPMPSIPPAPKITTKSIGKLTLSDHLLNSTKS